MQAIFAPSLSSGGIMTTDTLAEASEAGNSLDVVMGSFVTSLTSLCGALGVTLVSQPLLGELATFPCFHHLWAAGVPTLYNCLVFEDILVDLALSGRSF